MSRQDNNNRIFEKEIGTYWFRRLVKDCERMSPYIKFKRIKYEFYRIYWIGGGESAYIGECYASMPEIGYEWTDIDARLDSKKYYEEYEDRTALTRKIKNFVEGYWETLDHMQTRIYMFKNNKEFRDQARKAYSQFIVK